MLNVKIFGDGVKLKVDHCLHSWAMQQSCGHSCELATSAGAEELLLLLCSTAQLSLRRGNSFWFHHWWHHWAGTGRPGTFLLRCQITTQWARPGNDAEPFVPPPISSLYGTRVLAFCTVFYFKRIISSNWPMLCRQMTDGIGTGSLKWVSQIMRGQSSGVGLQGALSVGA